MSESLNVIVVDDDPAACEVISDIIRKFYVWGEVLAFTDTKKAIDFCHKLDTNVAIFVLDVFLGEESGFSFLDAIREKYPMAHDDAILITGNANEDVVNMCVAEDITHLLQKPVRSYALQLAVRSIVTKYIKFAQRLLKDPELAKILPSF